ncbi:MAG TPA: nitroreductase/quinone reductase family protein [Myxococcota bacterium]|nr:nitroreductase/quinone reductase family protein [Myxococcota bacterium]
MAARGLAGWFYRGGKPNAVAWWINRIGGAIYGLGILPNYAIELEVVGRRSGQPIRFPLVMALVDSERYLVSMLGSDVAWVRNLEAAHGHAVLRHGRVEPVQLEPVPVERRPPILKAYLKRAPGGRPHIPVDKDAPLEAFAAVAPRYPVFRVVERAGP